MPVFDGRSGVLGQIAHEFRVNLGGRVVSEGNGEELPYGHVAVDGFGNADHAARDAFGLEVFRNEGRVGVGIVTAHHDQTVQLVLEDRLLHLFKLLRALDLRSVGSQEIESAGVQDLLHLVFADLKDIAADEPLGPLPDTDQEVIRSEGGLDARQHVVTARGGPAREKNGDPLVFGGRQGAGLRRFEDAVGVFGDGEREYPGRSLGIFRLELDVGFLEGGRMNLAFSSRKTGQMGRGSLLTASSSGECFPSVAAMMETGSSTFFPWGAIFVLLLAVWLEVDTTQNILWSLSGRPSGRGTARSPRRGGRKHRHLTWRGVRPRNHGQSVMPVLKTISPCGRRYDR